MASCWAPPGMLCHYVVKILELRGLEFEIPYFPIFYTMLAKLLIGATEDFWGAHELKVARSIATPLRDEEKEETLENHRFQKALSFLLQVLFLFPKDLKISFCFRFLSISRLNLQLLSSS